MRLRFALLAGCALLAVAACEKSPPPFAKVDGEWRYRGSAIPDADAASFVVLSDHYAKDRAHVWYADTYRDGREYYTVAHPRVVTIRDADPATFRYLARDIAKDGAAVYDEGKRMRVRDAASWELMDYGFARDRHAGYCYVTEIKGSDGASFVGECRYADTGVGAAMALGSQNWNGNCALLVKAPSSTSTRAHRYSGWLRTNSPAASTWSRS